MASQLSTGTNSGTQTTTQSPQNSAAPAGGPPAQTGSVQPGTAAGVLNNSQGGVPLKDQALSVVNLNATTAHVAAPQKATPHHTAPVLYGISGVLFAAAIVLFWMTARVDKSTT